MEKECKKHGLTEFSSKENGARSRCRKCSVEAVQKRRDKVKQMAVDYKGGKCTSCGYSKYLGALEFHHVDKDDKEFSIGHKGNTISWEKIKIELDKCILLCSNCHKELHNKMVG